MRSGSEGEGREEEGVPRGEDLRSELAGGKARERSVLCRRGEGGDGERLGRP